MPNFIKIPSGGGMNATLLWTNPNPNSSIGSTDIKCDNLVGFNYLLVESKETTSKATIYQSLLPVRFDLLTNSNNYYSSTISSVFTGQSNWVNCGRKVGFRSDKKTIWFDVNMILGISTTNNSYNIPLRIYGIKGKINGIEK